MPFYPTNALLLLFLLISVICLHLSPPYCEAKKQGTSNSNSNNNIQKDDDEDANATIHVFYINLERRPDRNVNIQQEFVRAGTASHPRFQIHRFNAIDGLTHKWTEEETSWFRRFDQVIGPTSPHNTNLLKANSLSHMGVWKRVLELSNNAEYAVVFQDDVQLASLSFVDELEKILRHNPPDAIITWIGINGYAAGSVSRSAPLDASTYNPDQISTALDNSHGTIGRARKGLISTNSLAYILTRQGAQQLLDYFTSDGWSHHTDHALVDFLDDRDVSYISRKILATTHDDGILGSDIFSAAPNSEQQQEIAHCEHLVQTALGLSMSKYSRKEAIRVFQHPDKNKNDGSSSKSTNKEGHISSWISSDHVQVQCEPMNCYFMDCPAPVVTYVYLRWSSSPAASTTTNCDVSEHGTTSCLPDATAAAASAATDIMDSNNNDLLEMDSMGVRRDLGRKKIMIGVAPKEISLEILTQHLPAFWTLEEWSRGNLEVPHTLWPRFGLYDPVQVRLTTTADTTNGASSQQQWKNARIVAVGYREEGWPTYATYVVQVLEDNDNRLIPIVQEDQVRPLSA